MDYLDVYYLVIGLLSVHTYWVYWEMISKFVLVVKEDVLCLSYCPIAVRRQHDQESLESNGGLAQVSEG